MVLDSTDSGHVELVLPQLRLRRLPVRPAREPRRRLVRRHGAGRVHGVHDAAALPGPDRAGAGAGAGGGAGVATAARRRSRRGAESGGAREEASSWAEVAQLAGQCHLGVAHLLLLLLDWSRDCGKQVYLDGFDTAYAAARAYDRAAIKFRGVDAAINFSLGDYVDDLKQLWCQPARMGARKSLVKSLSKEEFVHILRRMGTGIARGSLEYRGMTLRKSGRREARMGQLLGKKMDDDISTGTDDLERIVSGSKRPDKLKLSVLRHITENFSDKRKIGQGGCGVVYKGILPSGQVVAVKKLFSNKTYDDRMFQQEVTAMMMVEHQNTIRFLGYCSHIEERALEISGKYILAEERERLLCFDYISKGGLHDYVTDELRGLEWHTRFQVIKGICEGLHHLHKEKGIIHMDLKPANILLDDDFVPKITDFGISRLGEISVTMSKERLFSLGYCAPEYQFCGKMSFKSDIYGVGVIMREMVTGSKTEPDITTVRRRWMHRWKKSGQYIALALAYQQQVTECLELAERCMHRYPIKRPTIQDVICQLNEMDRPAASHINSANNSTFEQKMRMSSFSEDMIGIEPLQLHFPVVINKQTSCSIQLTNDTDDYIAFRVLTASRLPCCIHPNNHIIPPRSICIVTIALEVQQKPLLGDGIEEFCVQSTRVDEGLTVKDILETEDMFEEEPDKIVDMVNLTASICAPKQYPVGRSVSATLEERGSMKMKTAKQAKMLGQNHMGQEEANAPGGPMHCLKAQSGCERQRPPAGRQRHKSHARRRETASFN